MAFQAVIPKLAELDVHDGEMHLRKWHMVIVLYLSQKCSDKTFRGGLPQEVMS